jgi:hypothetical protein
MRGVSGEADAGAQAVGDGQERGRSRSWRERYRCCIVRGVHQVSSVVDPLLPVPPGRGMDLGLSSLAGLVRMGKSEKALPPQVRAWVEARKRHRLSHAQVLIPYIPALGRTRRRLAGGRR